MKRKLARAFALVSFALLVLAAVLSPLQAQAWPARVVAVSDGDSLIVEPAQGGDRVRVRLHGIDAPERRQPYGQVARTLVINSVLFKEGEIQPTRQGTDRFGRVIALVEVPGVGVLQELLLQEGLAWVWSRHCRDCDEWEAMQAEAKKQRLGLWHDENPYPRGSGAGAIDYSQSKVLTARRVCRARRAICQRSLRRSIRDQTPPSYCDLR